MANKESLLTKSIVIDGETFTTRVNKTGDGLFDRAPTVPAAKKGTLTTRTDDNTGTFTMNSGHGFATSDVIDLFWSGGLRYGMTATVTGDSVVLDGGTGDILPAAATAITATKPHEETFPVDGDALLAYGVRNAGRPSVIRFLDDADALITDAVYLSRETGNPVGWSWSEDGDGENAFAGVMIGKVLFSNSDGDNTRDMLASFLFD